jgi:hypothetical protein
VTTPATRALLLLALCAGCALEPSGGITIRRAAMVADAAPSPPPASDARWQDVTLPDRWPRARRSEGRLAWYRASFELDAMPDALWAVGLPLVVQNAAVRVNGEPVGDGGRFAPHMARNWNRALLFTVPPGLLHAGRNVVDVRLGSSGVASPMLGTVQVGPAALLGPPYARLGTLQAGIAQATTAAAVVGREGGMVGTTDTQRRTASKDGRPARHDQARAAGPPLTDAFAATNASRARDGVRPVHCR